MMAEPYPTAAGYYSIPRNGITPRALIVHMAEGGGVVGYMSRPNRWGVTSEYACERSGRIVQLIDPHTRAGTTIRVSGLRTTDESFTIGTYPVRYGWTAARAVLGSLWRDPNRGSIAIEVEGFARYGPNPAQRRALALWIARMRDEYPSLRGILAHRDLQAYKPCPGRLIPWRALGGHGLWRPDRGGGQ